MSQTHWIHLLPKSHPDPVTWARLIAAQRDFRLHALRTNPASFSSTYAKEAAFNDSQWEARLQNPLALTLIAVRNPKAAESKTQERQYTVQDCIEGEWEGTAVLFGPSPGQASTSDDNTIPTFEIFGLFVLPSARGRGIGTSLVEVSIGQAVARAGSREVIIKVRAAAGNAKVVGLYGNLGFDAVQGKEVETGEVVMELRRGV